MYKAKINCELTARQKGLQFLYGLPIARHAFMILCCLLLGAEAFTQIIINPNPVIKAPSTTTITSSANPSYVGQPVLLTATITSAAQGTPTGTVHFFDNATNTDLTPAGVTIVNGKATFTTAVLSSNASYYATYSGDAANVNSTSAVFSQTVNNPPIYIPPTDIPFYQTTTSLVSSSNPSVAGSEPVTFTATVSGGNNATGRVEFWDNTNNTNLTPAGVILTNGVATFTTSSLPFGDLNITATYRGDASGNQQSTSNSVIQRVQLNITGIGITLAKNLDQGTSSTPNTTNWGDRVTLTATVSTGIGAPSGTVTFTDNGFLLGTVQMDAAGNASITTNLLTPGNHTITASYLFITSNIVTHKVDPPFPFIPFSSPGAGLVPSRVALIQNVGYNVISDEEVRFFYGNKIPYGKPVTFAAFVSGLEGYTPTGNVVFQLIRDFDVTDLGEVGLDVAGNAFFTTSILPLGRNTIRIIYSGNDIYEPNVSSTVVEVEAAPTTTTISSNLNPSIAGQQITFTAVVPPAFAESNAIPPQGDVTFIIDGINQTPAPLTGNFYKAFFDISSLTPGTHTIKAHYPGDFNGGDPNYKGSTSGTITQVVEKVGDGFFYFIGDSQNTPVNTAFPNPLMFNIININPKLVGGASVTFTAPSSGASGTFSNGTNTITIKTTSLNSFGVANSGFFTANGIAGTYTVTAYVPGLGTATFTMTNTAVTVPITVSTSIPGLGFSVDGTTYSNSQTFNWESGSTHTLVTTSPQSLSVGNQYTFTGWTDGTNTLSRTITVPSSPTTYTAQFECSQEWVLDKDADDYYTGAPVVACQSPGEGYVPKGDLNPGDCNDNDANINPQTIWLLDTDGDGYHEKIYIAQPSCLPPQDGRNYINNSKGQDCNDNDATYNPETIWVMDADGDGYYTGDPYTGCFFIFQPGYVRKTTQLPGDCNDNDALINPATVWVIDADGDSYYTGSPVTSCTSPGSGRIVKTTQQPGDCNDADAESTAAITWYLDADGDGYAASTTTSCTNPGTGYTSNILPLGDCKDDNALLNPATVWYEDRDGDGYPSGDTKTGCESPKFYYGGIFDLNDFTYGRLASALISTTIIDCNDANSSLNPVTTWYKDADNDGYSDGTEEYGCIRPTGYKLSNEVFTAGDCDDNDATINPNTKWYPDLDNDGYSVGVNAYRSQCTRPQGHKRLVELSSTTGDCDDNNHAINPNTVWYKDADNDGYTDGTPQQQCQRPAGYKLTSELVSGFDCNDANASINPATVWYKDADNDGYSDGTPKTQCTQPTGYKLATALTATSGDCNDADAAINPATVWYKDADNDGYSNNESITQCTQPIGYKLASALTATIGDCNDNDPVLNAGTKWYKDADDDGYSSGFTVLQCTRPTLYKLASELLAMAVDCNDGNASVNPGAVEICRNGIDDNCNGAIDEAVCVQCGNATSITTTAITSGSATLVWTAVANPEQWQIQYKTTNKGSKWLDVFVSGNKRSFILSSLQANQTYIWQIRAKCGKSWTDYAPSATFKTLRIGSAVEAREEQEPVITAVPTFEVITAPNPSDSYFTLTVKSSNTTDRILVRVMDELGRVVEQKENVMAGTTVRFGDKYIPGMYFVMVQQGKNSKAVKLVRR